MRVAQGAGAEGQGSWVHRVHGGLGVVRVGHIMQLHRRCHGHVIGHWGRVHGLCGGGRTVVHWTEEVLAVCRCPGVVVARCCALVVRGGSVEGGLGVVEHGHVVRADHLGCHRCAEHWLGE